MAIKSVLNKTLDNRGLNKNQIHVEGKVRLNTIHEIANIGSKRKTDTGKPVIEARQIKLETLDAVIKTINMLSPASFAKADVSDILRFVDDNEIDEEGED